MTAASQRYIASMPDLSDMLVDKNKDVSLSLHVDGGGEERVLVIREFT